MTPKAGHPVSRGLSKPFRAYDEFYYNLNFDKSCNHCYPLTTAIPTKQNMIRYGSSKFWNRQAEEKLGTPQALIWCKDPPEGARGLDLWAGIITVTGQSTITGPSFSIPSHGYRELRSLKVASLPYRLPWKNLTKILNRIWITLKSWSYQQDLLQTRTCILAFAWA